MKRACNVFSVLLLKEIVAASTPQYVHHDTRVSSSHFWCLYSCIYCISWIFYGFSRPDLFVVDRDDEVRPPFCPSDEHCLGLFGSKTESMVAKPIPYYLDCGIFKVSSRPLRCFLLRRWKQHRPDRPHRLSTIDTPFTAHLLWSYKNACRRQCHRDGFG